MKSLFAILKLFFVLFLFFVFQNCTDKDFVSPKAENFQSDLSYCNATITGNSSMSWTAKSISIYKSTNILITAYVDINDDYIEFYIPLFATSSTSYNLTSGASFTYRNPNYSNVFDASYCGGNVNIFISERTESYIKGTFSAIVHDPSTCGYFTISSGNFQAKF